MGDFKHGGGNRFDGNRGGSRFGGRDGGRPNFQKKSWGGDQGGNRGPATMHQAVCSECRKACEVPFRPVAGKPVYCTECFGGKKNAGFDSFSRKDFNVRIPAAEKPVVEAPAGNNDVNRQLQAINVKLEKLIQIADALVRAKNGEQKEAVKTAPVVKAAPAVAQPKVVAIKEPAKKKEAVKVVAKKTVKKAPAKKGKK